MCFCTYRDFKLKIQMEIKSRLDVTSCLVVEIMELGLFYLISPENFPSASFLVLSSSTGTVFTDHRVDYIL